MSANKPPDDHRGEEEFHRSPGEAGGSDAQTTSRDRGLGTNVSAEEKNDSGFFGVGENDGEGDDNLERETEPGYQADKWDRGTIMPH